MRTLAALFGAITLSATASFVSAQQLPKFNVGDSVDTFTSDTWVACTVASPLSANGYTLRCGSTELTAKNDPSLLRSHVASANGVREAAEVRELISRAPLGESVGARFGTREPRTCQNHKTQISGTEAKDIFICDAEHEFGGNLYLVSDVSLLVSDPRPYNPNEDKSKAGIDASQPVFDIRASYNNYQCSQLPSSLQDYPGVRNCNETKMSNAAGGCFKNTAGEWHCMMYDFKQSGAAASASLSNVKPPTLVD